jgi:hypothetical protein
MARLVMLLLLATFSTGCIPYTFVHAPGATGRVQDAATLVPVKGARIIRPAMMSQRGDDIALPSRTVVSDERGDFDVAPARHTQFVFMYRVNPYSMTSSFLVSADGYATNELHGVATSRISWRAEFGAILLGRP